MKKVFLLLNFLFSLTIGAQKNGSSTESPFKAYIYNNVRARGSSPPRAFFYPCREFFAAGREEIT